MRKAIFRRKCATRDQLLNTTRRGLLRERRPRAGWCPMSAHPKAQPPNLERLRQVRAAGASQTNL